MEPILRRIFTPEEEKSIARIDNIIRQCYQTRLRNEELGDAIYYEMFETLFGKQDRQLELRDDFCYEIRVTELTPGELPGPLRRDYFKVTTQMA